MTLNTMTQERDELAVKVTELQESLENKKNDASSLDKEKAQMTLDKKELESLFQGQAATNQAALETMTQARDTMTQERDTLQTKVEEMDAHLAQKDAQLSQNEAQLEQKSG